MFKNLLFMPLDIPAPPKGLAEKFDGIDYKDMIQDDYRSCYHIPIVDKNYNYTHFAKQVPELINWIDNHIFTWCKGRIMIITTPPGEYNPDHIDCSPDKFLSLQHKLRYVIQGRVDSLEFVFKDKMWRPEEIDQPFIMSGKWPHHMLNDTSKRKYTFALGAPWEPTNDDHAYVELLTRSYNKYKHHSAFFENYSKLPDNWVDLFEDQYKKSIDENYVKNVYLS